MATTRIYADFNNLDDANRLRLTCAGTKEDLARQGITLHEGQHLTFWMDDADEQGHPDDILVDGVVHFDAENRSWVASVDWSATRHDSEEKNATANGTDLSAKTLTGDRNLS